MNQVILNIFPDWHVTYPGSIAIERSCFWFMELRANIVDKVCCFSTKQDKSPETRPYGSVLLECPCVWGEIGADGTGRVLGC